MRRAASAICPRRINLPKTRSGKIMRGILRKIAEDEPSTLGDTSTLADPAVVEDLVEHRQKKKGP
jgi:acetyl-CoA synthetase